jgi:hypothetical protein
MTGERRHAILLATVILTARRLQPLLKGPGMQAQHGDRILGQGPISPENHLKPGYIRYAEPRQINEVAN